jgi:hypothetical protein
MSYIIDLGVLTDYCQEFWRMSIFAGGYQEITKKGSQVRFT